MRYYQLSYCGIILNLAWQRPTLTGGNPQLLSALKSLTAVFGMGTGVSFSLSLPHNFFTTCGATLRLFPLLHSSCTLVHSGVRLVTSLISLQFVKKCLFRLMVTSTLNCDSII
ncbi:hypothetical protein BN424_2531 [Carnobacterium maltaromaticum LMA28]|uniref:Uncharacterized protein n=1 Tax=Carnobacterium maltaromaticum LMA28 TaxID=1234679 RepID=R7RV69_CARML|nr:hypothetical protein BN424_2531 [Carnobacterium maltaromaticum LMA28]